MSEQNVAGGEVDWNAVDEGGRESKFEGRPRVSYLKVPKNGSARIRFVTKPRWLYKHSFGSPIWAISPGEDDDVVWKEGGYRPSKRNYAFVKNRADGAIQLYDFSNAILATIAAIAKAKNFDPTDPDNGCDFIVMSKVKNGPDGPRNSYQIIPDDRTPLTDSEKAEVAAFLEEKPLEKVCAPDSPEYIAKLWEEHKADPEGPAPGSPKYWIKKREEKSAQEKASGGVTFDDDASDIKEPPPTETTTAATAESTDSDGEDSFGTLFDDDENADESSSLF